MLWMGIDGGGSNLRVAVVDDTLRPLAESHRGTVNPSGIGHEAAKHLIQEAMREVLLQFQEPIQGVGIGVAGAAADHSTAWLHQVVTEVLPDVFTVASSDFEIALVGATGERKGILLLAGTGSVAYGINDQGNVLQVGGRGYLLGDEGSGYWIGIEALRMVIGLFEGTRSGSVSLSSRVLNELQLQSPTDLIPWLYHTSSPRIQEVARLAPIVISEAEHGDAAARQLIEQAAQHLQKLVITVANRLKIPFPTDNPRAIAFAGGLLQNPTLLTHCVADLLSLPTHPAALHSPVVGAALLAKMMFEKTGR